MTLANPIFLWALTGLAIPVTIHLLSRKEGKVIRLGSVRHIVETSTQQFKGIRLNEILLLALRCSMIIILSLILSGLQCSGSRDQKWVVVESVLQSNGSLKSIVDSLIDQGYEPHHLGNEFPNFNSNDSISKINYWKLAEDLRSKNLPEVVVFASNRIENFKGPRIELPKYIKWLSVPLPKADFSLSAINIGDSIATRTGRTSSEETSFDSKMEVSTSKLISASDTISVLLANDQSYAYDLRIIKASLEVIEKSFPIKLNVEETAPSDSYDKKYDWCFWLSDKKVPLGISSNKIHISIRASNDLLVQQTPDEWTITHRLNEEVALRENLTSQLSQLIIPRKNIDSIAKANDRRMLPDSLAWSPVKKDSLQAEAALLSSPADRYLIICFLLLLLAERLIAFQRKQ